VNREIKYRVWDIEDKRWIKQSWKFHLEGDGTFHTYQKNIYEGNMEYNEVRQEFYTIQQFTGLKDKNGKDIYEGDLVTDTQNNLYEVYWLDVNATFDLAIRNETETSHLGYNTQLSAEDILSANIEVIGNIFDNKDLLK